MNSALQIAPCGVNCYLCIAYIRAKNRCPGCNALSEDKNRYHCRIKHCEKLPQAESGFCYDCKDYPCRRLKQLDKRYRTRYGASMIHNLHVIKDEGVDKFVDMERQKWTCKGCGTLLCIHRERCLACGNVNENYPVVKKDNSL